MSPRSVALRLSAAALALLAACAAPAGPAAPAAPAAPANGATSPGSDLGSDLGSTRGSVPAIPADAMPAELVYLASRLDEAELAQLRAVAPNVRFVDGLNRDSALAHAADAHGADAHLVTAELLAAAPRLAWVQAHSAGVDRYIGIEGLDAPELVFTNMKGMHGPVIAEHVFATLLSLTRNLDAFRAASNDGRWERGAADGMTGLYGRTMLVVGLGGIGTEIARRADAFGMEVLATARTPRTPPAFVDELGVAADLDTLLPRADVVALAVPLTDETRGMIDARRLALMPAGSYLVNIARGPVVDTEALVAALDSGHLAGACLDVTDPEPLPEGHTLWGRPNVVVTPHVAARAEVTGERRWALFVENVRRFGAGEPLLNVVDKEAGY